MRSIELVLKRFVGAVKIDYDDKRIYLVPLAWTVAGFSLASYALIKALFHDCTSIAPCAVVVDPRKPINWKRNVAIFSITFFATLFALGAFSYFRAQ
ncbi:hypothetical protein LP421_22295 [Rhizobium sp. RCAM05350]|nr:hypothetical protein LP421_22295 [Rhizobium sp. RCAM05350]